MNRQDQQLQFITQFVDAATIRPFFEDLRRTKQLSMMLSRIARATTRAPTYKAA